jgi:hypothetical protein
MTRLPLALGPHIASYCNIEELLRLEQALSTRYPRRKIRTGSLAKLPNLQVPLFTHFEYPLLMWSIQTQKPDAYLYQSLNYIENYHPSGMIKEYSVVVAKRGECMEYKIKGKGLGYRVPMVEDIMK